MQGLDMKLRCKDGDLALVVFDTIECASNIGRLVKVSGPVRVDTRVGGTWLIEPVSPEAWAVEHWQTKEVVYELPPLRSVEHPDAWLVPMQPPPEQEVESDRCSSEMNVAA